MIPMERLCYGGYLVWDRQLSDFYRTVTIVLLKKIVFQVSYRIIAYSSCTIGKEDTVAFIDFITMNVPMQHITDI